MHEFTAKLPMAKKPTELPPYRVWYQHQSTERGDRWVQVKSRVSLKNTARNRNFNVVLTEGNSAYFASQP